MARIIENLKFLLQGNYENTIFIVKKLSALLEQQFISAARQPRSTKILRYTYVQRESRLQEMKDFQTSQHRNIKNMFRKSYKIG